MNTVCKIPNAMELYLIVTSSLVRFQIEICDEQITSITYALSPKEFLKLSETLFAAVRSMYI